IRDPLVTGVQTCALPIYERAGEKDVIDAEPDDQVADARFPKHVTFETYHAGLSQGRPELRKNRSKRRWPSRLSRAREVAQQAVRSEERRVGRERGAWWYE